MDGLYNKLVEYSRLNYYPMHMPGHKRNVNLLSMVNPYQIDITEVQGFDNLHQAEGILKELAERIKKLYGAGRSFPLVNGSTAGILAGISAATVRGDRVLLARNCHRAVYNAVQIRGLEPVYIYPECIPESPVNGGISASKLEEMLITYPDIRLVIITSPTYEGIVSDINKITEVVHRAGALLLVDEAHGAHFGFHEALPRSAVTLGADIVIQSLHKTLPAFTQSAVIHINRPELEHRIEQFLAVYESSSPSYLLLAGMEQCVKLLEEQAGELFQNYYVRLQNLRRKLRELRGIKLFEPDTKGQGSVYTFDPSKLTLLCSNRSISGAELSHRLREEYHIEMELTAEDYVLGITSICDTPEGFARFYNALHAIIHDLKEADSLRERLTLESRPVQILLPHEALELESEEIGLFDSVGRIAADYISVFPPGIPVIVPGEQIDGELLRWLVHNMRNGLRVTGLLDEGWERIGVIKRG